MGLIVVPTVDRVSENSQEPLAPGTLAPQAPQTPPPSDAISRERLEMLAETISEQSTNRTLLLAFQEKQPLSRNELATTTETTNFHTRFSITMHRFREFLGKYGLFLIEIPGPKTTKTDKEDTSYYISDQIQGPDYLSPEQATQRIQLICGTTREKIATLLRANENPTLSVAQIIDTHLRFRDATSRKELTETARDLIKHLKNQYWGIPIEELTEMYSGWKFIVQQINSSIQEDTSIRIQEKNGILFLSAADDQIQILDPNLALKTQTPATIIPKKAESKPKPPKLRFRKSHRRTYRHGVAAKTESHYAMLQALRADRRYFHDLDEIDPSRVRPRHRGDCEKSERPCLFAGCRHHLALDPSDETGSLKLNFPDLEVWEIPSTCSLDIASEGGVTLERIGELMNLTRERVRQMEISAIRKIRSILDPSSVDVALIEALDGADEEIDATTDKTPPSQKKDPDEDPDPDTDPEETEEGPDREIDIGDPDDLFVPDPDAT